MIKHICPHCKKSGTLEPLKELSEKVYLVHCEACHVCLSLSIYYEVFNLDDVVKEFMKDQEEKPLLLPRLPQPRYDM